MKASEQKEEVVGLGQSFGLPKQPRAPLPASLESVNS
jgi:hypothetical protein